MPQKTGAGTVSNWSSRTARSADVGSFVFESVDPLAAAAHVGSDEEPAGDEAEDNETRDDRLRREPPSSEHLTLHDRRKICFEFYQGGKMLKRYCKRVRQSDADDEKLIPKTHYVWGHYYWGRSHVPSTRG